MSADTSFCAGALKRGSNICPQRAQDSPYLGKGGTVAVHAQTCRIERTRDGLRVSGELDLHATPDLREEMIRLVEEGHRDVVVDLTETTFLDSTALGALAGRYRELRARGGSLAVICSNENVRYTLEIAGVDHALRVCRSREELELGPRRA
jgi:anti-sigma B factor antagonist